MTVNTDGLSAQQIAQAVTDRKLSALDATEVTLARIAKHDPVLNSFTDITAERARAKARAVDAAIAAGQKVGPLAGVPFAVKNLFDVKGLSTRAGSKINRDLAPSSRDATLIDDPLLDLQPGRAPDAVLVREHRPLQEGDLGPGGDPGDGDGQPRR